MFLSATDISLLFLGVLLILVLFEVRKLGRRPEPVRQLEAHFERLSRHMERIAPLDIELPAGARIVEAADGYETIAEQLERLGESAAGLDHGTATEDDVRRLVETVESLRAELRIARELADRTGATLRGVEQRLEQTLAPLPASTAGRTPGAPPSAATPGAGGADR